MKGDMERPGWMSQRDWDEACERGRLAAASRVATNLEARIRVETAFGIDFCRKRWPEAYKGDNLCVTN